MPGWAQGREWPVWAGAGRVGQVCPWSQDSSASWGSIHFRKQTVLELGQSEGRHMADGINAVSKDGNPALPATHLTC